MEIYNLKYKIFKFKLIKINFIYILYILKFKLIILIKII